MISQGRLKCPAPKSIHTHILFSVTVVCFHINIVILDVCCWLACEYIAGGIWTRQDLEEWRYSKLAMEMYIAYYNKVAACCILTLVDPDNYIHTQRTADDVGILSNRTNKYPHRCKKFSIDLTMTKFGNFPCI